MVWVLAFEISLALIIGFVVLRSQMNHPSKVADPR
jgi:hypothetical protein